MKENKVNCTTRSVVTRGPHLSLLRDGCAAKITCQVKGRHEVEVMNVYSNSWPPLPKYSGVKRKSPFAKMTRTRWPAGTLTVSGYVPPATRILLVRQYDASTANSLYKVTIYQSRVPATHQPGSENRPSHCTAAEPRYLLRQTFEAGMKRSSSPLPLLNKSGSIAALAWYAF